jgi:hypothetical protein
MTPDLTEQRLREQLHAAAEAQTGSYLDVDPLTALDTGQRALRRRRIATVAGTTAAALAIGLGGWAVLSDSAPDDRTLPAVTNTVNGPSVTLPLGADPASGSEEPLSAVVTVDQASGKVEFRLRTETGSVLNSQVRSGSDRQAPWANLSDSVMAAVVPAEAAAFVPVWSVAVTQQDTATEVLPDGRIAAAWRTDVPSTGPQFAGVVWTDGTSAITAGGEPVSSVVVDETMVIFGNNRSGAFGYLRPEEGSVSGSGAIGQAREGTTGGPIEGVWAADASGDSGTYVVYMPPIDDALAAQTEVLTTSGATVRDIRTYFPNENARLVVAHIDGTPDAVIGATFPGLEDWPRFG